MMKVRLLLFAVFRDIVGTDRRELTLAEGATALDVWKELRSAHRARNGPGAWHGT